MPLIIFAGGEIVLALIAARIAWWIVRSGGWRLDTAPERTPDPPPTREVSPRRAGLSTPPLRRRTLGDRCCDTEDGRELAS